MSPDLRSFLDYIEEHRPRELLRISAALDPNQETAAVVRKLQNSYRRPVVIFENVKGSSWPVVTNLCASLKRIADSAGWPAEELHSRLRAMHTEKIDPVMHSSDFGPVRDTVRTGNEVDLGAFPRMRYTGAERHPYITGAVVVAWDAEHATVNASFHRLMIVDARRTAIFMTPGGHLREIVERNGARGRRTPAAAFIGCHPLVSLGCLASGGRALNELASVGRLLGRPLDVTQSMVDQQIGIPSNAEIALEGFINPEQLVDEGPYGEFAGYVMPVTRQPVFEIEVVTHRNSPYYQDFVAGGIEHLTMTGAVSRAHLEEKLSSAYDGLLDLHMPAPMTLFLKVDSTRSGGPGSVRRMLQRVLEEEPYIKFACAFDTDIDLRNQQQTWWAIATRVQADRDVELLANLPGTLMDPSEVDGRTSKFLVDATATPSLAGFPAVNDIDPAVWNGLDLNLLLGR